MKKTFVFLVCALACVQNQAEAQTEIDIGPRVGIFIPESELFRNIYHYKPIYGLESTLTFYKNYQWWVNLSYYRSEGESVPLGNSTTIQMIPLSTGFNYILRVSKCFSLFAGAGASADFVTLKYSSPFLPPHTERTVWGGVGKIGVKGHFQRFYATLFMDYYYQHLPVDNPDEEENPSTDIGGFVLGISGGLRF